MTHSNEATRPDRVAVLILVLTGLHGCGGGDAQVVRFSPADGASQVDIRPLVQVRYSDALEATSVTADHVRLTTTGFAVPATVAYDEASHTITLTPKALRHDTRYDFTVSGLVDTAGHPVPDAEAHFTTWINAPVEATQTVQLNDFATHFVTTLDADGHPAQTSATTPEGTVTGCTTYRYTDGRLESTTQWDPGQDGKCSTADDEQLAANSDVYDARGILVAIDSRDRLDTEPPWGRERFEYDALGDTTRDVFELAGPDGVVGTQDDVPAHGYAIAYDAQGNPLNTVYNGGGGPGPDGVLFTDDDIIEAWVVTPGVDGAPDRSVAFDRPGADGLWLTLDDDVFSFSEQWHDARGNVIRSLYGILFEGDWQELSCTTTTYDSHDNRVNVENRGAGPDGRACTADDPLESASTYDTAH